MHCENKPLLQADPRFFQDITSSAVEVGLGRDTLSRSPFVQGASHGRREIPLKRVSLESVRTVSNFALTVNHDDRGKGINRVEPIEAVGKDDFGYELVFLQ